MSVGKCRYLALFQTIYNEHKFKISPLGNKAKPASFAEKDAADLEYTIKHLFRFIDRRAWKIDVQGTIRELNGRRMYTNTSADKGVSDIITVERGLFIAIEVKIGRDTQSEKQKQFERDVLNQGGKYLIVKTFKHTLQQLQKDVNFFYWPGTERLLPLFMMLTKNGELADNSEKST